MNKLKITLFAILAMFIFTGCSLKKDNTEQKQEILDISEKNFLTNIYKILEYYKTNKEVLKTKDVEALSEEIKAEKELRLVRNLPKNELEN